MKEGFFGIAMILLMPSSSVPSALGLAGLSKPTWLSLICRKVRPVGSAAAAEPTSPSEWGTPPEMVQSTPVPAQVMQSAKPHRVLIQIDQNDPAVMNLALNNATNIIEYYRSKGKEVAVDVVTYGPGLHMLRADTSPVQDRIKQLKNIAFPSTIQFSACNVTRQGMEKREGHPIDIMSDAVLVPSGVIHLMELQEDGWSYIRP